MRRDVAAERKARREHNRARGTGALAAAGVPFAVLDDGWHLRIEWRGETIDYMPSTGAWSVKGKRSPTAGLHRGNRKLIHYLATGEL